MRNKVEILYIKRVYNEKFYFKDPEFEIMHHPTIFAACWYRSHRGSYYMDGSLHHLQLPSETWAGTNIWALQGQEILKSWALKD